jgi:hypothetical protein
VGSILGVDLATDFCVHAKGDVVAGARRCHELCIVWVQSFSHVLGVAQAGSYFLGNFTFAHRGSAWQTERFLLREHVKIPQSGKKKATAKKLKKSEM